MKLPLWPLKFALRGIPDALHSRLLSHSFNHLLKGQSFSSRLDYLQGKRLWLTVTDTGNTWQFQIQDGQFLLDRQQDAPEIHISGRLDDFLLLATRSEDPDTLFFARRLSMEGNTEDGLYLKNMIDAMEFDSEAHFKAFIGEALGIRLAAHFKRLDLGRHLNTLTNH
ncbi:hypothetical protein MNBD_GAMMA25-134 [hydrothermal vent metagenome]|uniref:SCP2 domain-containing protein n=1 Tax=hydrothermal vent metagenome TaxID=652676 RepID=A0A3B1BFA1_9ZZZZ